MRALCKTMEVTEKNGEEWVHLMCSEIYFKRYNSQQIYGYIIYIWRRLAEAVDLGNKGERKQEFHL